MQGKRLDDLVGRCAETAARGKHITSYVILYQERNGSIRFHADGQRSAQIGMLETAKLGFINGLTVDEEG